MILLREHTREAITGKHVFFVFVAIMVVLVAYGLYLGSLTSTWISLTVSSSQDCLHVGFVVANAGFHTFHGWSANVSVSPLAPIIVNPASIPIEPLAGNRVSSPHNFTVSFTGVPSGVYELRVNILNGTRILTSSSPFICRA